MNEPEMPGRIMAQIASASTDEHHGARVGDRTGLEAQPEKDGDGDEQHDVVGAGTGRDEIPADQHRRCDKTEEESGHLLRILLELGLEHRGESAHGEQDADRQREQERDVEPLTCFQKPRRSPRTSMPSALLRLDPIDERLVDADDQGDGSTGHTGDDVGRSHQQATDELGTDLGITGANGTVRLDDGRGTRHRSGRATPSR